MSFMDFSQGPRGYKEPPTGINNSVPYCDLKWTRDVVGHLVKTKFQPNDEYTNIRISRPQM